MEHMGFGVHLAFEKNHQDPPVSPHGSVKNWTMQAHLLLGLRLEAPAVEHIPSIPKSRLFVGVWLVEKSMIDDCFVENI